MKKACAAFLFATLTCCVFPVLGSGTALHHRIIALAPSLTELVFEAGAGEKLIAVSAYSDYPAPAKKLPVIADANGVAFERVLALKPDLILAWKGGNRESDLTRLRSFGLNVVSVEVTQIQDISPALRQIGDLAGTEAQAEAAARRFDTHILRLKNVNASKKKVSVFFEISRLPLLTINRHHAIDDAISLCGGVNVFRDSAPLVFSPSREQLLRLNPDVILHTQKSSTPWAGYEGLQAIQTHRYYRIDADLITRTGPRILLGAESICKQLDQARNSLKEQAVTTLK